MKYTHILRFTAILLAFSGHHIVAQCTAPKPNVLFICIDDLVPALGCYGDSYAQSPHIDAVAAQGTTFLNHHTQWAVCGPSRACLSTGLMPEETGVRGFRPIRALLPDVVTLPQHFRNSGYETAATGKFHDPRTVGTIVDPNSTTTGGGSSDDVPSWSIPYVNAGSGYSPSTAPSGKKYATNSNTLATGNNTATDYADGKIFTEGINLIDQVAVGSKPFFLAVGFKKPHLPFLAPKQFWDLYDPSQAPLASYEQLPLNASTNNSALLADNGELRGYEPYYTNYPTDETVTPTLAEKRDLIHGYYACVSFIDAFVGQLTAKLASTADPLQSGKMMSETTIVVIWGDHGFGLGEHGKWAKHTNMEHATSCPLIIYDPRNPTTGQTTTAPAQTIDIYPTLCELTGLSTPTQPIDETVTSGRPLSGRSLVPVLNDPESNASSGAISLFSGSGAYGYAYRTADFRYIEWVNNSNNVIAAELYDYRLDPNETRAAYRIDTNDPANDITDPAYETIAYALSRSLRSEVSSQGSARFWDSGSDTYSTAPNRLQASTSPLSHGTLQQNFVPFLCLERQSASQALLQWPNAGAVTFDVVKNTDLSSTWNPHQQNISTNQLLIPTVLSKEFFRVTLSDNESPVFRADPIVVSNALVDTAYSASISAEASDPNAGDSITYSKIDGPTWLSIGADGTLSGTPTAADACPAYFTVRATDNHGSSSEARLHLGFSTGTINTFNATDDTYAKQSDPNTTFGSANQIQLRQDAASSFARLGFVKFTVAGLSTVTSAKLYLYSDDEADTVNVHAISDTSWTQSTLNWSNKPTTGTLINTATATPSNWFYIDVTAIVTGDGTYAFALDEQGNSAGKLKTSEAGFAPYLEITHSP